MKILLLCAVSFLTYFVSASESEIENLISYGICEVWEEIDAFTDARSYHLKCEHPDTWTRFGLLEENDANISITLWPDAEGSESYIPILGFNTHMKFHFEDTISVKYRFGKNEVKTETFLWDDERGALIGLYKDTFEETLKLLSDSDKVVFDLDGDSETIDVSTKYYAVSGKMLLPAEEAVEDFRKRIKDVPLKFEGPDELKKQTKND